MKPIKILCSVPSHSTPAPNDSIIIFLQMYSFFVVCAKKTSGSTCLHGAGDRGGGLGFACSTGSIRSKTSTTVLFSRFINATRHRQQTCDDPIFITQRYTTLLSAAVWAYVLFSYLVKTNGLTFRCV